MIKEAAKLAGWSIRKGGQIIDSTSGYFGHLDDEAILDHLAAHLRRLIITKGYKMHVYNDSTYIVSTDMQYTIAKGENHTIKCIVDSKILKK